MGLILFIHSPPFPSLQLLSNVTFRIWTNGFIWGIYAINIFPNTSQNLRRHYLNPKVWNIRRYQWQS
jgi:hypothetical protein